MLQEMLGTHPLADAQLNEDEAEEEQHVWAQEIVLRRLLRLHGACVLKSEEGPAVWWCPSGVYIIHWRANAHVNFAYDISIV